MYVGLKICCGFPGRGLVRGGSRLSRAWKDFRFEERVLFLPYTKHITYNKLVNISDKHYVYKYVFKPKQALHYSSS